MVSARALDVLATAAARRSCDTLLEAGVEIWEWAGAMVHAKTAVFDEEISLVDSSNLDPLSMLRNYEFNLLVVDAPPRRPRPQAPLYHRYAYLLYEEAE